MIPACDRQTVGRSDGRTVKLIMANTALCIASYADSAVKTVTVLSIMLLKMIN